MEIKTPNCNTETPIPSAPPAEGIGFDPEAQRTIGDAARYLIQVLDPLGVAVDRSNLSQLTSKALEHILDTTDSILSKLLPSAPPLEPAQDTPSKPTPSAPPLPLLGNGAPAFIAEPRAAPRAAPNANPTNQIVFTGIATNVPNSTRPQIELGKVTLTTPIPSNSIVGSAAFSATPLSLSSLFQSAKNTPSSTPEPIHSAVTKTTQSEPPAQTVAAPVTETESAAVVFSESFSFTSISSAESELIAQTVFQTEQNGEDPAALAHIDVQSVEIFESEKRSFNAPFTPGRKARESEKEQTEESAKALDEKQEFEMTAEQESRSTLENTPPFKAANSHFTTQTFSQMDSFVQEITVQNQSSEKSPLSQGSLPLATSPNSIQGLGPSIAPPSPPLSPEKSASPSEMFQQAPLQTGSSNNQALSSQMPSGPKSQVPFSAPTRQALSEARPSQELFQEQGATKTDSKLTQNPNQSTIVPYSSQPPIQGSSPSKSARTGSVQPVAEFPDEDFDEDDEEEDEEDEDDDDDNEWY